MPVPVVGNIYTVAVGMTAFGQQGYNTASFRLRTVGDATDDEDIMADLGAAAAGTWASSFIGACAAGASHEVQWNGVIVTKAQPADMYAVTYAHGTVGTALDDIRAFNTSACISRYGAGPPKRRAGRVAIPGGSISARLNGKWNAAELTRLSLIGERLIGIFLGPITNAEMEIGFWRDSYERPDGVVLPAHFQFCEHFVVRDTVRTQRTRTVNVGI